MDKTFLRFFLDWNGPYSAQYSHRYRIGNLRLSYGRRQGAKFKGKLLERAL